jgi:phenylpropionate dioxygenase-like ring-hydroxylating dioxygenase large terminal subunit
MFADYWYMVGPAKDLKDKMRTLRIGGENIIVFRDESGTPVALEDRCCHRNVQLSLGYLERGKAVCGYHGWEFNGSGQCVHIPSQRDEKRIPQTARIRQYPLKVHNRWMWIFMGEPERAGSVAIPDIPEMADWPYTERTYVFKGDLESVAESLIDPYHIAFTHKNSIKQLLGQIEEFPADFNLKYVDDGLEGIYERANKANAAERMYFGNDDKLNTFYKFYFPNISRLQVDFKDRTLLILEHVMPVDANHVSMTQITLWKNIFKHVPAFARFFMARKSHKIVMEDIALLTSQFDILRKADGDPHEVNVKGDEISIAFRKYWREKWAEQHDRK